MTYIWHPNIMFKEGIVYNKILNNNWKSSYSIINVIESIFEMCSSILGFISLLPKNEGAQIQANTLMDKFSSVKD